ncbi:hypothetical protein [Cognatiluteimonas profundi]|uniref:hypothetical protein n=1 Tax=Cognatiluteimonas profundi TaxID=2594501 RepID=UPI00131E068B|nr:hypothetical protein [Lysobacter profundi]
MNSGSTPASQRPRKLAWIALALLILALAAGVGLRYVLQQQHVSRLVLDQLGRALGLTITSSGTTQYSVRGTPTLVIRDVIAVEPGATAPLLRADRIFVSLPWSTIRALTAGTAGTTITMDRIELDHPSLDLDALQRWLAHRPPGKTRYPVLRKGLKVTDGRITTRGWSLDAFALDAPLLAPDQRFTGHVAGRYRSGGTQLPFDLRVVLSRPTSDAALGLAGQVAIERDSWRMPSRVVLSGMLHVANGWRLERARLAAASRYQSGGTSAPFAAGIAGTLQYRDARTMLAPLALVVHGSGVIPDLIANGNASLSETLGLKLAGTLPTWPDGWPALPPPIGASRSPLAFGLQYLGSLDLSDPLALQLRRDAALFDGSFRAFEVSKWLAAGPGTSPIPPLTGRVSMPRLDIAGAQLQGVDISISDSDAAAVKSTP